MERKALTEDQMLVLGFAPAEASDESLARKIGAPVATVHNAHWRLKR